MGRCRKGEKKKCLFCQKEFLTKRNSRGKYCDPRCQHNYQFAIKYAKFLQNEDNVFKHAKTVKKALIRYGGYSCWICGINTWLDKPLVIEIDHMDGNDMNNKFENVRLLCPNCHTQTYNYKRKNKAKIRGK